MEAKEVDNSATNADKTEAVVVVAEESKRAANAVVLRAIIPG